MDSESIFNKMHDFWMSREHYEHLVRVSEFDSPDEQYRPIAVEIDGVVHPYTACCAAGDGEPFENALKNFPDYRKVATGTLRGFRYR